MTDVDLKSVAADNKNADRLRRHGRRVSRSVFDRSRNAVNVPRTVIETSPTRFVIVYFLRFHFFDYRFVCLSSLLPIIANNYFTRVAEPSSSLSSLFTCIICLHFRRKHVPRVVTFVVVPPAIRFATNKLTRVFDFETISSFPRGVGSTPPLSTTYRQLVLRVYVPESLYVVEHEPRQRYDHQYDERYAHEQHRRPGKRKSSRVINGTTVVQYGPLDCKRTPVTWYDHLPGLGLSNAKVYFRRIRPGANDGVIKNARYEPSDVFVDRVVKWTTGTKILL